MITYITLNEPDITDFSKARNKLLGKVKKGWVFFVDSDERVSKDLKRELVSLDFDKFDGFFVPRNNYFIGQYVGKNNILRLGKIGKGTWYREVHEVWNIKSNVGQIKNPLIHNTADNLGTYLNKINRYSTLHSVVNKKEGKTSNLFKIVFFPIFKFLQSLLNSKHIVFSIMQSFHSFLSWSKQYLKEKN